MATKDVNSSSRQPRYIPYRRNMGQGPRRLVKSATIDPGTNASTIILRLSVYHNVVHVSMCFIMKVGIFCMKRVGTRVGVGEFITK